MKISILRKNKGQTERFWQSFIYEPGTDGETVATALSSLNKRDSLTDADGKPAEPIEWDCGCLQKKCGACAMVINGTPGLACSVKLSDIKGELRLEPFRKFPVVQDLIINRSILHENLARAKMWLEEDGEVTAKTQDLLYEASRCLQCGCCLEVCPNFYPNEKFFGMATAVPMTRVLTETDREKRKPLVTQYNKHVYAGCGKSLSCRNICPAGIDIDRLLVKSNSMSWGRK